MMESILTNNQQYSGTNPYCPVPADHEELVGSVLFQVQQGETPGQSEPVKMRHEVKYSIGLKH